MTKKEKLALLDTVLIQSGVSRRNFSLGECSDDRVCLEYNKQVWTIYMCERGHKLDTYESEDLENAVSNFVSRLVESQKKSDSITKKYFKELSKHNKKENNAPEGDPVAIDIITIAGNPRLPISMGNRRKGYLPMNASGREKVPLPVKVAASMAEKKNRHTVHCHKKNGSENAPSPYSNKCKALRRVRSAKKCES